MSCSDGARAPSAEACFFLQVYREGTVEEMPPPEANHLHTTGHGACRRPGQATRTRSTTPACAAAVRYPEPTLATLSVPAGLPEQPARTYCAFG